MSKKTTKKRKRSKTVEAPMTAAPDMPNPIPPNAFTTARVDVNAAKRLAEVTDKADLDLLRQFSGADAISALGERPGDEFSEREREVRNIDLTLDDITDEGVKRSTIMNDSGDEIAIRLMASLYAEAGDKLASGATMEDVQECLEYVIKKMQAAVKAMVGVPA